MSAALEEEPNEVISEDSFEKSIEGLMQQHAEPAPTPAPEPDPDPVAEKPKKEAPPEPEPDAPASDLPSNPNFGTPVDAEIADKPPGKAGSKAISTWEELRAAAKQAKSQTAELTAQLENLRAENEQLKSAPQVTPQLDETKAELVRTKAELEALQKHLKAADYTRTPEYAQKVKEPEQQIRTALTEIASNNDTNERVLWDAITETDPKVRARRIDEISEGFTRAEQHELVVAAREYQRLQNVKARLESEAETLWTESQTKAQREQEERIRAFKAEQAESNIAAFKRLQEQSKYLKRVTGADKWNAALDATEKWLRDVDFDTLSTEEAGTIMAQARALPYVEASLEQLLKERAALTKERDQLREEVKRITSASPSVAEGSRGAPASGKPDNRSFEELAKEQFGFAG